MQIAKQGLPEGLIRFWGTLFVLRPFFDQSALEYLTDSNNQEVSDFKYPTYSDLIYQLKEADKKHKEHQEIVNGSSVRPTYKLYKYTRSLGARWAPTSSLWPFGPA